MKKQGKAEEQAKEEHDAHLDVADIVKSDPVLRFLYNKRIWQTVALLAVAVACVVYIYNSIQEQALVSRRLAADSFSNVRDQFERFSELQQQLSSLMAEHEQVTAEQAALEVELNEARARLEEIIKSLADSRTEYRHIAELYRSLTEIKTGNYSAAKAQLQKFDIDKVGAGTEAQDFYNERAALMLARLMLDEPDTVEEGRELLSTIVSKGMFLNTSAAFSLALIASTAEEKQKAFGVISNFVAMNPEQAELLEDELRMLSGV